MISTRFDPYKNLKFRIKWDGKYVAGFSNMTEHRKDGDPSLSRKSLGKTTYEAITLSRGVTHDKEFEKWVNKAWNYGRGPGSEVSLKDLCKDVIVEVCNEAGQKVLAYKIYRCWVSEYNALPKLDSNTDAIVIQTIKLENEGCEKFG